MAGRTGYEPLGQLKPFGPDIWIVDGPNIRFYGMPFPTRMTVVRLRDGGLWLHSPIALDEALQAEIAALGPVRHLVAPNWIHYASVYQWQEGWPEAPTWAAPGVAARAKKHDVPIRIDTEVTNDAAPDWSDEIPFRHVTGSPVHSEVVFFHGASRTLILTDLIENFAPEHLPWWMSAVTRLAGIVTPDGRTPPDIAATFRKAKPEVRAHIEWMIGQGPEKVIMAHGRPYEEDAVPRLRHAFRQLLR
ncbi:DUF4336 domain-containing protein [Pseudooceanicola sp.]|uniref:DUF4336 domain-containing protein n=1 Tax=Pseudooceanicola sp. TaxID=1914328 RepID=UPI0035C6B650